MSPRGLYFSREIYYTIFRFTCIYFLSRFSCQVSTRNNHNVILYGFASITSQINSFTVFMCDYL